MKLLREILLIFILFTITFNVFSQDQNRDQQREKLIENSLFKIDSTLLPIFKEATVAMDISNLKLADSLYSIIYKNHPTFDPVLRRLGGIRFQSGKPEEGINLCREAVNINRSAYNLFTLSVCLSQPGKFQNYDEALTLLEEARSLSAENDFDILSLTGHIQLQKGNIIDFRKTVELMSNDFSDQMLTHYYEALLAVQDKNWLKAKEKIELAKNAGLSQEAVYEFLDSGVKTHLLVRTFTACFIWIVVVWAFGLFTLFILGRFLSKTVMGSIDDVSKVYNLSRPIKATYKWLMNIGGIYYYFSLPIILILVIILAGGLTYIFFLIGQIPIKLLLLLLVGSVITIYSMVRSLFVKTKYVDPGRILKEEEAPGLFSLIQDVAGILKTKPIDEIRITYGTDLAVYEKGSWRQKRQEKAKRILILGAAVVGDFRKSDFRAVLAHEYGHFAHRDTAGGDVALRVKDDMEKYLYSLYMAGQNVWWNIAFQFLRLYNFLFRRISYGCTRLQEILADSVAAKTFGAVAFMNGLTHVIKRDIEFSDLINLNVEEIRNARPSIDIYRLSEPSKKNSENLEKQLNCTTTDDDTHPSPKDRFKFVSNFDSSSYPSESGYIAELFPKWEEIQKEMREFVDKQIANNL